MTNSFGDVPSQEFPDLDDNQEPAGADKKSGARPFVNQLFPNDSLTECTGFINDVREHVKGDRTLYFISVGLFQGSIQEGDSYKGDITNCDLLAGPTLEKWFSTLVGKEDSLKGIRFAFEIRNLKFVPKIHEGKPYMDSRGILETVKIGRLNK